MEFDDHGVDDDALLKEFLVRFLLPLNLFADLHLQAVLHVLVHVVLLDCLVPLHALLVISSL